MVYIPLLIFLLDLRANLTSNEAQCYIFCSLGFHKVLIDTIEDHSRIDEYVFIPYLLYILLD